MEKDTVNKKEGFWTKVAGLYGKLPWQGHYELCL